MSGLDRGIAGEPLVITSTTERIVRVAGNHRDPTWVEIQAVAFRDGKSSAKTIRLTTWELARVCNFVGSPKPLIEAAQAVVSAYPVSVPPGLERGVPERLIRELEAAIDNSPGTES